MPLVKILKDYDNVDGWGKGDVVDITDPGSLIEEGKAVLVSEEGKEIEASGEIKCPICLRTDFDTALELADHIYDAHPYKSSKPNPGRKTQKAATSVKQGVEEELTKLTREEALEMVEKKMEEGIDLAGITLDQFNPLEAMSQKEQIRRQKIQNVAKARKLREAKKRRKAKMKENIKKKQAEEDKND